MRFEVLAPGYGQIPTKYIGDRYSVRVNRLGINEVRVRVYNKNSEFPIQEETMTMDEFDLYGQPHAESLVNAPR